MASLSLGIYEKALPRTHDWNEFFALIHQLKFNFVDLSIDEDPQRIQRLFDGSNKWKKVKKAAEDNNVTIGGICLSAHRRYPLGSPKAETEEYGKLLLEKAIHYAHQLNASIVQIAGYYTFYEPHDAHSRDRFIANLQKGVECAAKAGVMLGIENVDGEDITNMSALRSVLHDISSPWLQAYPDVGNCAFNEEDIPQALTSIHQNMCALHVKDVLPGRPRKVPFGTGLVNFDETFQTLKQLNWSGRIMIEMWNDDVEDKDEALDAVVKARDFIMGYAEKYGFA